MRRIVAPLLLVALLQTGCLGHLLAGIGSDSTTTEQYSVPPQESDARLTCGETSCTAAPVEQTYRRGRSKGVFWTTFLLELGTLAYGIGGTVSALSAPAGQSSVNVPALVAIEVGFWFGLADIISYAKADDYGRQSDPARLAKPVFADWRGMTVPLRVTDVAPYGVEAPKSFSVATAASKRGAVGASPQAAAAPRRNQPPPGAKITSGKVAVLDLKCSTKEISDDDVRYFGDLVRGATLKAAPQLEVMTRENLLVLLQASGKDLANCEGECEVDTGRRIGADAIVSGEVLKVGSRYKLSLRLHETHDGKLLGAAVASGKNLDELDDSVGKAAADLFGSGQ